VDLRVFDVLGRELAVLVNEVKPAGSYMIGFHADNLASGTYYYSLMAGHTRRTKTMTLVR
jgi:hypothetical protein